MEICEDLLHKEGPLTEAERRTLQSHTPVSYTHLDVYKRQPDLNWWMRVLQTLALPLGHVTIFRSEFPLLLERPTRLRCV